ncbi:MAG: TetR/AcrR family transcriptional regulator [Myxococcales bacterium]
MRESLSRAAVVHAARALLSSEGPSGLSLRRLASRLDVTAAALYAYVDNKGDLLQAVLENEFEALSQIFAQHRDGDPITRVCSVCWAYVHHARGNAKIFRTMFLPRTDAGTLRSPAETAMVNRLFEATLSPLVDGIEQGLLRAQDPQLAQQTLWTTVHGTTAVLLLGAPTHDATAAELCDSVIRTVVRGLCTERGAQVLEQVQMPALAS